MTFASFLAKFDFFSRQTPSQPNNQLKEGSTPSGQQVTLPSSEQTTIFRIVPKEIINYICTFLSLEEHGRFLTCCKLLYAPIHRDFLNNRFPVAPANVPMAKRELMELNIAERNIRVLKEIVCNSQANETFYTFSHTVYLDDSGNLFAEKGKNRQAISISLTKGPGTEHYYIKINVIGQNKLSSQANQVLNFMATLFMIAVDEKNDKKIHQMYTHFCNVKGPFAILCAKDFFPALSKAKETMQTIIFNSLSLAPID